MRKCSSLIKYVGMNINNKLVVTIENRRDIVAMANAGADEICLSLDGFSITALHTFSLEELKVCIDNAADFHIGVSVLVNKLFHERELEDLRQLMHALKEVSITSIYFADLAVLRVAQQLEMVSKLIYMPDTMMTSPQDAQFYLQLGLDKVAVSPLLTKQETIEIIRQAKEVVIPVYGHMVMSFSYRKLLTSWKNTFGYAENVDDTQNLYLVEEKRDGKMPVFENEEGTLIYTDYVLDSFDILKEFQQAQAPVYFMTGVFLNRLAYIEAVHLTKSILNGEEVKDSVEAYKQKFKEYTFLEGYYNEKTVR